MLTESEALPKEVVEQVEIQIKYEGYIEKSLQQVEKLKRMENKKYQKTLIMTLSMDLQQKRGKN